MEKGQNKPESQLAQRHSNFPILRKSSSLAKPIISLAKVELDSNINSMDQTNSKFQSRQILTSLSHKRIGSGVSIRQMTQTNFSKTSRSHFYEPKVEPKRLGSLIQQQNNNISNSHLQSVKEIERPPQTPTIDKAKISTKSVGFIKGYAVNSHPGMLNTSNEDRICIVTNLNRTASKQNQVSFFSVYDGKDGVSKAEYFRDNFHNLLSKDQDFQKDIELAIKKTYHIVEEGFKESHQNKQSPPSTALNIALIFNEVVYFIQSTESKAVFSSNLGSDIDNPFPGISQDKAQPEKSHNLSKYKYFIKNSQRFQQKKPEMIIRRHPIADLDFVVLGSQVKDYFKISTRSTLDGRYGNLCFAIRAKIYTWHLEKPLMSSCTRFSIISQQKMFQSFSLHFPMCLIASGFNMNLNSLILRKSNLTHQHDFFSYFIRYFSLSFSNSKQFQESFSFLIALKNFMSIFFAKYQWHYVKEFSKK